MNKKNLSIITLILSILLSFGFFYFKDFFAESQKWGLLGIFIINFLSSATFFVSGPAILTVITGGGLYPPLFVAFVASLGASSGDMISYLFGISGRHLAQKELKNKTWFVLLEKLFKKYSYAIVFVFAVIPNPIFDAIGLIAGIMGMKYYLFFLIMLVGRLARFFILALIGARFF